jgi:hypothetical protein
MEWNCLSDCPIAILSPQLLPVAEVLFPTLIMLRIDVTERMRSFPAQRNMKFWQFNLVHRAYHDFDLSTQPLHLNTSFGEVVVVCYLEYTLLEYFSSGCYRYNSCA